MERRFLTKAEASAYCGLGIRQFSEWVRDGRLPPAVAGTTLWDIKAIDRALDILSGISVVDPSKANAAVSVIEKWKEENGKKGKR